MSLLIRPRTHIVVGSQVPPPRGSALCLWGRVGILPLSSLAKGQTPICLLAAWQGGRPLACFAEEGDSFYMEMKNLG